MFTATNTYIHTTAVSITNGRLKKRFVFFGVRRGRNQSGGRAAQLLRLILFCFALLWLWLPAFLSHSRHPASSSRHSGFYFALAHVETRKKKKRLVIVAYFGERRRHTPAREGHWAGGRAADACPTRARMAGRRWDARVWCVTV